MYQKIEAIADRFLELFAPRVEASAVRCWHGHWNACWQCNNGPSGYCGYNAPCSGWTCDNGYNDLNCYC